MAQRECQTTGNQGPPESCAQRAASSVLRQCAKEGRAREASGLRRAHIEIEALSVQSADSTTACPPQRPDCAQMGAHEGRLQQCAQSKGNEMLPFEIVTVRAEIASVFLNSDCNSRHQQEPTATATEWWMAGDYAYTASDYCMAGFSDIARSLRQNVCVREYAFVREHSTNLPPPRRSKPGRHAGISRAARRSNLGTKSVRTRMAAMEDNRRCNCHFHLDWGPVQGNPKPKHDD